MNMTLDDTHDPSRPSWVESAREHPQFPLQNLPLGRFQPAAASPRTGVAIGDHILDLTRVLALGLLTGDAAQAAHVATRSPLSLNAVQRLALRRGLSELLGEHSARAHGARRHAAELLHPQATCRLLLPCEVRGFTDFQAGIHHTLNGRRLRGNAGSLPFNYHQVPIGYNARASSVVVSGTPVRRPLGQVKTERGVVYAATAQLDIELELGIWIGGSGNPLGEPVDIDEAETHIAGYSLLNDWSARDVMAWEMDRLGPFTGKSFATTVSPWIISPEALAPFRAPAYARGDDPSVQPPAHLCSAAQQARGGLAIELQVLMSSSAQRACGTAPHEVSHSHTRHLYWTPAQLVAHHTSNGCNLQPGDLLGTGTISGTTLEETGCFKERSLGGEAPFAVGNERRAWAEDGDEVVLRAWAQREGARRIGFGECAGIVLPALEPRHG